MKDEKACEVVSYFVQIVYGVIPQKWQLQTSNFIDSVGVASSQADTDLNQNIIDIFDPILIASTKWF